MWYIFTLEKIDISNDILDVDNDNEILSKVTYIDSDLLKKPEYKDLENIANIVKISSYQYDSTDFRKKVGLTFFDKFCGYTYDTHNNLYALYDSDYSNCLIKIDGNPVKSIKEYIIFNERHKKKIRINNRYYSRIQELISKNEYTLENSYTDNAFYLLDAEKHIFLKYCKGE